MINEYENFEVGPQYSYQQYQELGGIINENDYQNALDRAQNAVMLDNKTLIGQAESIARVSGITLHNADGVLDKRIILYGKLRTDTNPGVEYHHSQMCDQQLFAEALRTLGDADALKKIIEAYTNTFNTIK